MLTNQTKNFYWCIIFYNIQLHLSQWWVLGGALASQKEQKCHRGLRREGNTILFVEVSVYMTFPRLLSMLKNTKLPSREWMYMTLGRFSTSGRTMRTSKMNTDTTETARKPNEKLSEKLILNLLSSMVFVGRSKTLKILKV